MDELVKRETLLYAKRAVSEGRLSELILPEDGICTRPLYSLLISQYATALTDQLLKDGSNQIHLKLPVPLLFAYLQQQSPASALKLLSLNIAAHDSHILTYNLAKLYIRLGHYPKALFHLEELLKKNPFFEPAVFEFCALLSTQFCRNSQAVTMLERHLKGTLAQSVPLQTLYLYCNRNKPRQVAQLFHKHLLTLPVYYRLAVVLQKEDPNRTEKMLVAIIQLLKKHLDEAEDPHPTDRKLLLNAQIRLARLYEISPTNSSANQNIVKALQIYVSVAKHRQDAPLLEKINFLREQIEGGGFTRQPLKSIKVGLRVSQGETARQQKASLIRTDRDFFLRRRENEKKLRFLVMKQKQLQSFFRGVRIKGGKVQVGLKSQSSQALRRPKGLKPLEIKNFELDFQRKRKMEEFKLTNAQLETFLTDILKNARSGKSHQMQVAQKTNSSLLTFKLPTLADPKEQEVRKQTETMEEEVNQQKRFTLCLESGEASEAEGKHHEALEKYFRMYKEFKREEDKQEVLLRIAHIFQKQEEWEKAEKTYLKCSRFDNAKAFLQLGTLLMRIGRIKSGVESIEKANCLRRFDVQIENKLVYGYSLRAETMDKALTLAHTILKKQPECLQTLLMTVTILQKQGKLKEAIDIATAIDEFRETQYVKHYIGLLHLEDSNVNQAFIWFKEALRLKANYCPSLIQIATILSELSPNKSIELLHTVLSLQPENQLALARLGKIYECIEEDYDLAIATYCRILESGQDYEAIIKIGDCHQKKGDLKEALKQYERACILRANHEAHAQIARIHQRSSDLDRALQHFGIALKLLPDEKSIFFLRREYLTKIASINLVKGSYEAAIAAISEVVQYEQNAQLYKMLAQAYFGKSDYDEALDYYERASVLAGQKDTTILESIGMCFDKKEEYLASKLVYDRILQIDPKHVKAMNNLANIKLLLGETNEAFTLFQKLLQIMPEGFEKRIQVADLYASMGDWSKVEWHLYKAYKEHPTSIILLEKFVRLYKEKRDVKLTAKFQRKINQVKASKTNRAL